MPTPCFGRSRHRGVGRLTCRSMTILAEVAQAALELSPAEQRSLARLLLEHAAADADYSPGAEAAWELEIGRRIEAVKSGTARHRSAEQVFERLDARFHT